MVQHPSPRPRSYRALAVRSIAVAGLVVALAGCKTTSQEVAQQDWPTDYRLRHPIAIKEGDRTVELFIGSARGGLTPSQRADVTAFAIAWSRESTGGIVIDVPAATPNGRAARDAVGEIRSVLASAGVAPHLVAVRPYTPSNPTKFATVKLNYPKMTATAGPCGLWPSDLGPTYDNRNYLDNTPYYNLGCSSQRNLAAMVENPADLAQPRGDTPIYAARRSIVLDKYRKGESTATIYPNANEGKISDVGK